MVVFVTVVLQAAEYETTLANITELEEALALAQDQVDASHRWGVLLLLLQLSLCIAMVFYIDPATVCRVNDFILDASK